MLKCIRPGKTYLPDMKKHEIYQRYQVIYDALYETTKDLMHQTDDIATSI